MIAGIIRLVTGVRPRWVDADPASVDPSSHRVYFANHTSHLDAAVIWASLPPTLRRVTRPVAAADFWDATKLRRHLATKVFRALLIDRHRVTHHHNPMTPMLDALDHDSLILFPEGTRAEPDEPMGPFKSGLFRLARKRPGLELVPVHLHNLNRVLPKGEKLFVPLAATVTFGRPITLGDDEDKAAFLDRAHDAVEQLAEADG